MQFQLVLTKNTIVLIRAETQSDQICNTSHVHKQGVDSARKTMHIYTFMTHTSRARPSVVDTRMRSLRIDMQVSRMDLADTKARPLYLERLYCVVSRTPLFVSMEARTIRGSKPCRYAYECLPKRTS